MLLITDNEKADLETIIDSRGLPLLLAAIATICHNKADHVQTNWQDAGLARVWEGRADKIGAIVEMMVKNNA